MQWSDLGLLRLGQLREAITIRIDQYEDKLPIPVHCPLCKIYDVGGIKCKGCPGNVVVSRPLVHDDRIEMGTLCDIYTDDYEPEVLVKFLEVQRAKIDLLMEDIVEVGK